MKELTSDQRRAVVDHLLLRVVQAPCKLRHGAIKEVAQIFGRTRQTIAEIWKLKYTDLPARIRAIPPQRRTTLQRIAHAIGLPSSTLKDYYKRGFMVKYNSHIKPKLTGDHKVARVNWAMKFVRPSNNFRFADMYDYVHVDEKWFHATKIKSQMYLLPSEIPPHRSTQSKRCITKVIFLWDQ
ncbi:hypothetical protein H257_17406 [Aphanomyces astaci]|uniref:Transposase Tc1-like domain-containing protein n=1 Tax=Aphanomyces astaci TaxID=112090 RepID=W4FER7_APHAT|nr:hypothetical protein H257_17406 [Aphanomyces astaci]ETV65987.1 hypothetical protein H257_17406 [Aphanomyces astaci]|eukprot:XP_009844506.1 hypothetical protein H257_17406 [Aphanomyces astaci]